MAQNQFEFVNVKAIITATSNKVSQDFSQETPTKTIYFTVSDKKKVKELEELGLTLYTPEDKEGKPYFIVKASKVVKIWLSKDEYIEKMFTTEIIDTTTLENVSNPNLYTEDEILISVVKVKAPKGKNDFYRINNMMVSDILQLKEVEKSNPFEEML